MDEEELHTLAREHYMAGLLDGMILIEYKRRHLQKECQTLEQFIKLMDEEFKVIAYGYMSIRGSELAEKLSDGG